MRVICGLGEGDFALEGGVRMDCGGGGRADGVVTKEGKAGWQGCCSSAPAKATGSNVMAVEAGNDQVSDRDMTGSGLLPGGNTA